LYFIINQNLNILKRYIMNNTFNAERRCLEKVELDMLRPDRFVGLHAHSTFS